MNQHIAASVTLADGRPVVTIVDPSAGVVSHIRILLNLRAGRSAEEAAASIRAAVETSTPLRAVGLEQLSETAIAVVDEHTLKLEVPSAAWSDLDRVLAIDDQASRVVMLPSGDEQDVIAAADRRHLPLADDLAGALMQHLGLGEAASTGQVEMSSRVGRDGVVSAQIVYAYELAASTE